NGQLTLRTFLLRKMVGVTYLQSWIYTRKKLLYKLS
ncbi:hypothetical protein OKE_05080, partial [Enterococcus faecium EnGen0043]